MTIDHQMLLLKYLAHVRAEEGADFVEFEREAYPESPVEFTVEEWGELRRLSVEGRRWDSVPREARGWAITWKGGDGMMTVVGLFIDAAGAQGEWNKLKDLGLLDSGHAIHRL